MSTNTTSSPISRTAKMNDLSIQELNNTTTNVSFDMLTTIDQMASEALREINWAELSNGEGFYRDRADIVIFKLQAKLRMLKFMIANVNAE
jgi:hypothetical protein